MMQAAVRIKHMYSYPRCEIQCCSVAVFAVLNAKTTKAQLPAILGYMKTLSFLWLSAISCLFTCLNGGPQVHGSLVAVTLWIHATEHPELKQQNATRRRKQKGNRSVLPFRRVDTFWIARVHIWNSHHLSSELALVASPSIPGTGTPLNLCGNKSNKANRIQIRAMQILIHGCIDIQL